jgi:GntR family transcriptional regulator, trigonelline degradation regulator
VQQQAVEKLRHAIMFGVFKPGERLIETGLCRELGICRPSVREALRTLESERLLSMVPNRGPQVCVLSWQEAAQIYQVRALLEGEAAALCAQRADAADLAEMKEALVQFGKTVRENDEQRRIMATEPFYVTLIRCCGNQVFEETLQRLRARINFLRARSMSRLGRGKSSLVEMTDILKAIRERDPVAARAAAAHHVQSAARVAESVYAQLATAAGSGPKRGTRAQ